MGKSKVSTPFKNAMCKETGGGKGKAAPKKSSGKSMPK